jgi:hypothetical protein
MSEIQNGPDWWQGIDGKWYPPVAPMPKDGPSFDKSISLDSSTKFKWARVVAVIGAIGVAVAAFAIFKSVNSPKLTNLEVRVKIINPGGCDASGKYEDINGATPVNVLDSDGNSIYQTIVGAGLEDQTEPVSCLRRIQLRVKAPTGKQNYLVIIGDHDPIYLNSYDFKMSRVTFKWRD